MRDRSHQVVDAPPTSTSRSDEDTGCLDRVFGFRCCSQRFRLPFSCRLVWLPPPAPHGARRPVIRGRSQAAPALTLPVALTSRRPDVPDEALAARRGSRAQPDRADLRVHRACKASRGTPAPPGRRGRRVRQEPPARRGQRGQLEVRDRKGRPVPRERPDRREPPAPPDRTAQRVRRVCKASRATPARPGRRGPPARRALRARLEPPALLVHREPPEPPVLQGRLAQPDHPDRRAQPAPAGCLSTRTSSTPALKRCRSRLTSPWIRTDS